MRSPGVFGIVIMIIINLFLVVDFYFDLSVFGGHCWRVGRGSFWRVGGWRSLEKVIRNLLLVLLG